MICWLELLAQVSDSGGQRGGRGAPFISHTRTDHLHKKRGDARVIHTHRNMQTTVRTHLFVAEVKLKSVLWARQDTDAFVTSQLAWSRLCKANHKKLKTVSELKNVLRVKGEKCSVTENLSTCLQFNLCRIPEPQWLGICTDIVTSTKNKKQLFLWGCTVLCSPRPPYFKAVPRCVISSFSFLKSSP